MELWLLVLAATTVAAQDNYNPFLRGLMSGLSDMPVIGNVLRASVHPLYQPLVSPILPRINSSESEGAHAVLVASMPFSLLVNSASILFFHLSPVIWLSFS